MRYDGVSHHNHHTRPEEAITDHTTTQTHRDQFVADMMQRMATLARTLSEWVTSAPRTLDDVEQQVVRTIKDLGAAVLAGLCQLTVPTYPLPTVPCACGAVASYQRVREATVKTVLDTITIACPYYLCAACHQGHAPVDRQLEFCADSISAGLDELLALLGATQDSFAEAATVLAKLTLVTVCPNTVRSSTEQLGQLLHTREQQIVETAQASTTPPAVRVPPAPRMYVSMDGVLVHIHEQGWKEVKLGTVYTTTSCVPRKRPERVEVRTFAPSFVADLTEATPFGPQLWAEAAQRGVLAASEVVVLGDRSHWIWNLAAEWFPQAVQILDWYHASTYLWAAAHAIYGEGSELAKHWATQQLDRLWAGQVAGVIEALQEQVSAGEAVAETITYYTNNQERMRYAEFRARGMQIGSGTIESGCKQVLGARLKQAGMIWDAEGAVAVASVRTWLLSGRWDEAMRLRVARRRTYQRRQDSCGRGADAPGTVLADLGEAGAPPEAAGGRALRPHTPSVRRQVAGAGAAAAAAAREGAVPARPAADHPWRRAWSIRQQRREVEARARAPVAPAA